MARRITTGIVGKNVLGALSTQNNIISSVLEDEDIILDPSGQGEVVVESNVFIQDQKLLKLGTSDASNWIGLRAPATVASNVTWTLPNADGSNNQVLTTNASGILAWTTKTISIINNTTDTAQYNVTLTSASSGDVSVLTTTDTKMQFQPSTGTFTCTNLSAGSITETSSIALKENIEPIENALDSILKLSGVTYDRKDSNVHEAGLIAEWVDEVLPDLVTKDTNGNAVGIKYSKLSAYLIECVKSLKQEIDALKGDNN